MIFNHGSYIVHAEVNAILNTNHASTAGQVFGGLLLALLIQLNSIRSQFQWMLCPFKSPFAAFTSGTLYSNFAGLRWFGLLH
jgi:hypothetical protein